MISIIIPVLNEARNIENLLVHISDIASEKNIAELIVVDGGSQDDTKQLITDFAKNSSIEVMLIDSEKSRARQMNAGVKFATGNILYFLHADSYPPKDFDKSIISEVAKGNEAGCFRMKFDNNHSLLKFSEWFTRFNVKLFRGGDQSLFVTRSIFDELEGFNEDYFVYEDCEFINRLYNKFNFTIIPNHVITSSRKYEQVGTWKLQYHFAVIHVKNTLGASPENLHQYYRRHIN